MDEAHCLICGWGGNKAELIRHRPDPKEINSTIPICPQCGNSSGLTYPEEHPVA